MKRVELFENGFSDYHYNDPTDENGHLYGWIRVVDAILAAEGCRDAVGVYQRRYS